MRLTLSLIFLLTTLKNKSIIYIIYAKEISDDLYLSDDLSRFCNPTLTYIYIDNEQSLLSVRFLS